MSFTVTRILRYFERKLDGPDNYEVIYSDPLNSNSMSAVEEKTRQKGNA